MVGYDDIAMASTFEPKLTTIHQPIYEMGRRSIQLMLHQTQSGGTGIPESVVLSASLVKRESVKKLYKTEDAKEKNQRLKDFAFF